MAATTYRVLGQQLIGTSETAIGTVGTAKQWVTSTFSICNVTSSSALLTLHVRPAGATASAVHCQLKDQPIAPGDPLFLTLGCTLTATDVISAVSDTANAIAITVYGTEIG